MTKPSKRELHYVLTAAKEDLNTHKLDSLNGARMLEYYDGAKLTEDTLSQIHSDAVAVCLVVQPDEEVPGRLSLVESLPGRDSSSFRTTEILKLTSLMNGPLIVRDTGPQGLSYVSTR